MKFLRVLARKFSEWWRPEVPPPFFLDPHSDIDAGEPIARYFVSMSKVNQGTQKLRAEAFMPHPHKEMSVFRVRDLTHLDVCELGKQEFADKLHEIRILLGWGRFKAESLSDKAVKLKLAPWLVEEKFHSRHRDVIGWPEGEDPKDVKARQKAIALELSDRTQVVFAASNK